LALKCVLSFQYARASNEIDQTGSGRNAFVAEEANRLGEQALIDLRELSEDNCAISTKARLLQCRRTAGLPTAALRDRRHRG
jgi:hypothetical protein